MSHISLCDWGMTHVTVIPVMQTPPPPGCLWESLYAAPHHPGGRNRKTTF